MKDHVYNLPVISQYEVAKDTLEVRLGTKGSGFKFVAGQYVSVTLPGLEHLDMREQFRDFSISSPPFEQDFISVTFRQSDSLFKSRLGKLPRDSLVEVEGPAGNFTLPIGPNQKLIFIAGGIGITPLRSMMRQSANSKLGHGITLLYFNTAPDRAAYLNELLEMSEFAIKPIYKKPSSETFADFIDNESTYFIAGPPPMTEATRQILVNLSVDESKLKFEDFSGYEAY